MNEYQLKIVKEYFEVIANFIDGFTNRDMDFDEMIEIIEYVDNIRNGRG